MATVLLLRHAESTWNRAERAQGWAPTELTDRGREQAAVLAEMVDERYDVDRLIASDLERAMETADVVAEATGLEPLPDRAWRERDFGNLQGFDHPDLFERYPRFSLRQRGRAAASARPDSGESLRDVEERVVGAWDRLCDEVADDGTVAVVTHGGPIYLVTGAVQGVDLVPAILEQEQDNCALNEVTVRPDGATTANSRSRSSRGRTT